MSDSKPHQFRPPLYHDGEASTRNGERRPGNGETIREQQGWEAYRKWLSTMNGRPKARRAPIDHSVYSWKGYNNWADRVRQAWESEEG